MSSLKVNLTRGIFFRLHWFSLLSYWYQQNKDQSLGLPCWLRNLRSWHPVPSLHGKEMGKQWKQGQTLFWGGFKITADGDCRHEIRRHLLLGRKAMTNLDSILKSRDIITFANKGSHSQSCSFSIRDMKLDHKESWGPKNWCFWSVVLEKTLESPLDCQEIKPVNPKGNQPWLFIERTDVEAEAPILWPPDVKSRLTGKDLDVGKDWRQEEREGDDRGWDGWMASLTQWASVWANSRK